MRIGRERRREDGELPLTPLIDVVFLLLIFFMASTTFDRTKAIEMDLPVAETGSGQSAQKALILQLREGGEYHLGGEPVPPEGLQAALAAKDRELPLMIRAHPLASSQDLVRVLDVARKLGLEQVSVEVVPPPRGALD